MPPQRRQSLAPTSNASRHRQVLGKKRTQSLGPGEANRHLVPRKSILKSTAFSFTASVIPSQGNENEPPTQAGILDDGMTENTGINYTAEISDNTTRKSFGRRVSFAPLASFRVFESNDNTNSTNGPSSSPTPPSPVGPGPSPPSGRPLPPLQLSNENDYPGRRSNTGPLRRVSAFSDYGERSMSLDMDQESDDISEPPTDPVFFHDAANAGSDYGPPSTDFEDGTEEEDDEEDMEITEAIAMNIDRKRSLSIAQQHEMARRSSLSSLASRRRSSTKFSTAAQSRADEDEDEGDDRDEEDVTANTRATQESEAPMEFTIAVGKPLKEPKPPSEAWLALKALTNGSADDDEENEEELELSSALSRLQQARSSLGLSGQGDDANDSTIDDPALQEASFTNTESSMDESIDVGDRTLNVTSLMGRVSNLEISADESRDASTIGDEDFARPIPIANTAPLNIQRKENTPKPTPSSNVFSGNVFSAPTPSPAPARLVAGDPEHEGRAPQRSHSPRPTKASDLSRLPLQLKASLSSSVFSAPPTPSRIPVYVSPSKPQGSAAASPAKKRPAGPHDAAGDVPQPSPAKKRMLENSVTAVRPSPSPAPAPAAEEPAATVPSGSSVPNENQGGMRRPSGYFAHRRGLLAPGSGNIPNGSRSPSPAPNFQPGSGVAKSSQPRHASVEPASAKGKALTQDQDENAKALTRSVGPTEPLMDKTASFTAPKVIVTRDGDAQGGTEADTMDIETEKQIAVVPRRSLVSPEVASSGEELDDIPSISIKEFFLMTGIKFHDYTIPRRSTVHPSQLQGDRRDSTVLPSMADYLTAIVVHIPQLELYRLITKDLQTFIDNSMKIYREAEEEVAKLTPILFREYAQANEEGREELLHQLKLIKANRLIAAKERWYDVRSRWIHGLQENVDCGFTELERDRDYLSSIIEQAQALLPALRHQHAQAQAQLEGERADIENIENSDPRYLEELKSTIEEQNQLLEVYKTDVAEGSAKIERLEGKLAELEAQRLENAQAIEAAERRITLNKTSTRTEVFRLKDELECLQVLHSWRVSRASRQLVQLVFMEQFLVSVPCTEYRPVTRNITISRVSTADGSKRSKEVDLLPLFSELVVYQAEAFARSLSTASIKRVVEALSDFWTSCSMIRAQFKFLGIKYPLKLELVTSNGTVMGLRAVASILLHKHMTKLLVTFIFSSEVLARWPFAIRKLECEVKTAYGKINPDEFRTAVLERLSEATVEDNHACLLDSCVEAASRFE